MLAGGGPKAMTALVGGGGQFSASVLLDGIMAHRRGLDDVRAIATLSYFLKPMVIRADIARQRGISRDMPLQHRLEAMKGLRVAITTPGASSDMLLRYLFLTNGMQPDRDLQIVPLGGVAHLVNGQRDAEEEYYREDVPELVLPQGDRGKHEEAEDYEKGGENDDVAALNDVGGPGARVEARGVPCREPTEHQRDYGYLLQGAALLNQLVLPLGRVGVQHVDYRAEDNGDEAHEEDVGLSVTWRKTVCGSVEEMPTWTQR